MKTREGESLQRGEREDKMCRHFHLTSILLCAGRARDAERDNYESKIHRLPPLHTNICVCMYVCACVCVRARSICIGLACMRISNKVDIRLTRRIWCAWVDCERYEEQVRELYAEIIFLNTSAQAQVNALLYTLYVPSCDCACAWACRVHRV